MPDISLDHQILPSRHLLARCRDQHGLLVWHGPGLGKSLTALNFMGNFRKYRVILVLPGVASDAWRTETEKWDLGGLMRKSNVIVLEYIKKNKKSSEDVATFLKNMTSVEARESVFIFDAAHHVLEVLSSLSARSASAFVEKLNRCHKILLLTSIPFYTKDSDFRILVNIAAGKAILPISDAVFRSRYYRVSKFQRFTFGWFLGILNAIYLSGSTTVSELTTAYDVLRLSETSWDNNDLRPAAIADPTRVLGVAIPILGTIAQGLANLLKMLKLDRLYKLDGAKLTKEIGRYISFVPQDSPKLDHSRKMPKIIKKIERIEYGNSQKNIWARFLGDDLKGEEKIRIGMRAGRDQAPIQSDIFSEDIYKSNGRAIGNLHFTSGNGEIEESPKFVAILDKIRKHSSRNKQNRAVFYSNYVKEGTCLFRDFLNRQGVSNEILHSKMTRQNTNKVLDDFRRQRIDVLILNPEFWEGVTIFGATQLHICEPMLNVARAEYIISRVAHLGSDLSTKTPIYIFQWCCTTQNLLAKVAKLARFQSTVDVSRYQYVQDLTPDALVQTRYNILLDGVWDVAKYLRQNSIEHGKFFPDTCNVFNSNIFNPELPLCADEFDL